MVIAQVLSGVALIAMFAALGIVVVGVLRRQARAAEKEFHDLQL